MRLPYTLPELPHLRLRITLEARGEAFLPTYKGSLLRGAFGHALRAVACHMGPRDDCGQCALRDGCAYPRLFETTIEGEPPPFLHGLPTSPRPFVFEPLTTERAFRPGDPLRFDLLLFGRAVELQGYAVMAVERMAPRGLGTRRVPFALRRVRHQDSAGGWHTGFEAGGRPWPGSVPAVPTPPVGALANGDEAADWSRGAKLRFLTPTRLMLRGKLIHRAGFRLLTFRMLRRVLELSHFYGDPERVDWGFHPMLEAAEEVRVASESLRWHDWERRSNRQKTKIKMGGFVGELHLEGDLRPLAPLLRLAEVTHVGKGATFGLGRVELAA